jgi:hypothetical protein
MSIGSKFSKKMCKESTTAPTNLSRMNRSVEGTRSLSLSVVSRVVEENLWKGTRALSVAVLTFGLTLAGLAANYDDFAANGYRWVTVDGPYGCPFRDDLQKIVKNRTDDLELQFIEQVRAYYLVRGALVKVVQEDAASGVSQIHTTGITKDLWTLTKFLSRRPIRDAYGTIESPEPESPNSVKALEIPETK